MISLLRPILEQLSGTMVAYPKYVDVTIKYHRLKTKYKLLSVEGNPSQNLPMPPGNRVR